MRALVETIEVDGNLVRLRTLAPAGRSRDALAPTIVLLHGLASSSRSFRRAQTMLSRHHRTIAIDLPGFGGVQDTGSVLPVSAFAAIVLEALHRVDVGEILPIGHGWGAQVAVELRRAEPDLVRGVGMIAPVIDDRRRGAVRQFAALAQDLAREPFVLGLRITRELAHGIIPSLPLVPRALRYPLFKQVASLGVPLLVVRGHRDVLSPHDWCRRLVGVADEAALIEIPGNHFVHEEQAGPLAAIVDEFLRVQLLGSLR
jgi:pimeloyl-ACP methyl ester carboxylesterase